MRTAGSAPAARKEPQAKIGGETASQRLATFASSLRYEDIPQDVLISAKRCIVDTIGVCIFGSRLPWSRIVADYAARYGGGPCSIIGCPEARAHAPAAALAHGVFAHAFEQDGSCEPNLGVHPGGTLVPAILAACEETSADGKTALTAFVAGCEVLLRVGQASHYSETPPETVGFHVPGLNGPFGSAVAASRVYGLSTELMMHALGIAGSAASGLLAFSRARGGGMVKRLHIGRSAESGIQAARLASDGFTAPEIVLEGPFGFLSTFCRGGDAGLFTQGLGVEWKTLTLSMKRYPCAMFAHAAVEAVRDLVEQYGLRSSDVVQIIVEGNEKLVTHHNITEPNDIMQAQYSVPFCIALALHRNPDDPSSFLNGALEDAGIRSDCRSKVDVKAFDVPRPSGYSSKVTMMLRDGRVLELEKRNFKGQPARPLSDDELFKRFQTLAADWNDASLLYEQMMDLENQAQFSMRRATAL
jgi:2-methylcitrate dehydratase PrpD